MVRGRPLPWFFLVALAFVATTVLADGPLLGRWYSLMCFDPNGGPVTVKKAKIRNNGVADIIIDGSAEHVLCRRVKKIPQLVHYLPCPLNLTAKSPSKTEWQFIGVNGTQSPAWRSTPHINTLNIRNLTLADEGLYRCLADTIEQGLVEEKWVFKQIDKGWQLRWMGFRGDERQFLYR
ncbi:hypothetical protein BIW11_08464 [Tropilaelaps mercedesae]|uniref:Ig-like domain-containing protein n=1 Tax=Tropilaelaps mercedesae TaxID=418985 RepID=A0A1V9XPD1_9ACAR|nr:hypothetical protein BIW11_08464 [Tropilaelaps mercedesae]